MADTFDIEVATPERLVFREAATEAQIPCKNGYIGVLPGHTPLLAELGIGELSYRTGGQTKTCTAIGGFVEVLADRVIVLADAAERAEEIDVPRAQAARERAQRRLATPNATDVDWTRAQNALARAEARLQAAAKASGSSVTATGVASGAHAPSHS